jgi:hypothetical protein
MARTPNSSVEIANASCLKAVLQATYFSFFSFRFLYIRLLIERVSPNFWSVLVPQLPEPPQGVCYDLLYPIDQLIQLVNWATFWAQYVDIYQLINCATTDKWQMTYG